MTSKEMKQIRADKAKAKYQSDPKAEQLRKFLFRVSTGVTPTLLSLKKYGYTLDAVNLIRDEAGFDPIENHSIKGYRREQMKLMVTDMDEVLKSVIPNVHVYESKKKSANSDKPVKLIHINDKTVFTVKKYIECIGHKVAPGTLDLYERMLRILLKGLGWTNENANIVPFLQNNGDFKGIQDVIDGLLKKVGPGKGQPYASGSKVTFYQCVSNGLHKDACLPFEKQMGPKAKEWWNHKYFEFAAKQKGKRIQKVISNEPVVNDWLEYKKIADEYIKNKKDDEKGDLFSGNPLENKTFIQIYTQLGGMPRTNTFNMLYVVDTKAEANDLDKNYYVTSTKTLIANHHKTGVDNNKSGEPIIVELAQEGFTDIAKNMDKLAAQKKKDVNKVRDKRYKPVTEPIIFDKEKCGSIFTKVFNKDNTYLRHSYTTYVWELRPENEALKIREAYIQSHSIDMAYNMYARKTNNNDELPPIQLSIPSVKPKGRPKKAAIPVPVPVPVVVVVPKAKNTLKKVVVPVVAPVVKPATAAVRVIKEIPISKNRQSQRNK